MSNKKNRFMLVGLLAIFGGPVLVAYGLNVFVPGWQPFGQTNAGELIQPAVAVEPSAVKAIAGDGDPEIQGSWTLAYVLGSACGRVCQLDLIELKQVQIALGRDYERLQRMVVFLHPDPGSVKVIRSTDPDLALARTTPKWPDRLTAGTPPPNQILLIDPQGFAVLRYLAATPGRDVLGDLKRLLKISKIG